MTRAMEMHDSYLREIYCGSDGRGYTLFKAVVYRSSGEVFKDASESGYQFVRFDFEGMSIEGEVVDLQFDPYASDGDLWVDETSGNGAIYLPANHSGRIRFEMRLNPSFDWLRIHASKIASSLQGQLEVGTYWVADGNPSEAI